MSDARAVVLVDLDGVLTSRDTFETLVTRRLRASPCRVALAVPALPFSSVAALRPMVARYLVRLALMGTTLEEAGALSAELGAEFARTPAWLHQGVAALVRHHLDAGDRVIVVTATETSLARTLLDGLGLGDAELVASQLSALRLGPGLRPHNHGPAKRRALARLGVPAPWSVLYTDSLADLPLMRDAQRVVLVGANDRLRRRVEAAARVAVEVISGA